MITPEFWSIPTDAPSESELARKTATLKQRLLDVDSRFSDVRFAKYVVSESGPKQIITSLDFNAF